jgi:hypothetical protein
MFDTDTTGYTLTVPNATSSITINAAVADIGKADLTGTGTKSGLQVGNGNVYSVVVTAEDNSTKTYTITVTRRSADAPPLSSNANLASLSVSGYSIAPTFTAANTSYTLTVSNSVSSITINATKADSKAKSVTGMGAKSLNVGSNPYNIVVTAENNSTKTYTITVTRDVAATDSTATDSTKPDSTKPDSTEPDSTEPDSTATDSTATDSTATDPTEPDPTKPDPSGNNNGDDDSTATAVETLRATSLQPYPNPTTGVVYIDNPDGEDVEVYNTQGILVETRHAASLQSNGSAASLQSNGSAAFLQGSNNATLDISHLPAGVYVIKVGGKAAKVVKR